MLIQQLTTLVGIASSGLCFCPGGCVSLTVGMNVNSSAALRLNEDKLQV